MTTALTTTQAVAQVRAANRGKVGHPFWSQIGSFKETDNVATVEDAIKVSGLDYEVTKEPLYLKTPDGLTIDVPDKFALTRARVNDKGETVKDVYGVVGKTYVPSQNRSKFDFFNTYLETGKVKIEAAGELDNGEKTIVVAKLLMPDTEIVVGDAVGAYLVLSDSYDGKTAMKIQIMTMRLVCSNGAVNTKMDFAQRLRHNRNTEGRLELAQSRIESLNDSFGKVMEQYKLIAHKPIKSQTDLTKYFKDVFAFPTRVQEGVEILSTKAMNTVEELIRKHDMQKEAIRYANEAFEGVNQTMPAVRGSYWAAYNAVTEYLNHEKGHNHNSRVNNLLFGPSAKISDEALQLALAA